MAIGDLLSEKPAHSAFQKNGDTVETLIKAPLKNNYDQQMRLVWSEKHYLGSLGILGAPCLEKRLCIRAQLTPFQLELQQPSCNRPS